MPKEVESIIFKATNKDLNLRYKHAQEMKEDIISLYNNKKAMKKGTNWFTRFFGFANN